MSQGVKEAEVERILIMMNGGNEYQINERVFANNIHHPSAKKPDLSKPKRCLDSVFFVF